MNDFEKEHQEFLKKRKSIHNMNKKLMREWESIPWYRFWERPSFEEKRTIILRNWDSLRNDA